MEPLSTIDFRTLEEQMLQAFQQSNLSTNFMGPPTVRESAQINFPPITFPVEPTPMITQYSGTMTGRMPRTSRHSSRPRTTPNHIHTGMNKEGVQALVKWIKENEEHVASLLVPKIDKTHLREMGYMNRWRYDNERSQRDFYVRFFTYEPFDKKLVAVVLYDLTDKLDSVGIQAI